MKENDLEFNIENEKLNQEILFELLSQELDNEIEKNLNKSKKQNKKKKRKAVIARLKSTLTIKTVLILLLTLIVNTYAWFIYVTTVSTGISMHVRSWDFDIVNDAQQEEFEFVVEQIYPGMPEEIETITAKNNGETEAKLTCDIFYVRIFDEVFETGKTYPDGKIYTSKDLFAKIKNDYPFKTEVYANGVLYDGTETIMATGDTTEIQFKINWKYETLDNTGNVEIGDNEDTFWGEKSHKYMETNPDKYSIEIRFNVQAVQTEF